MSVDAGQAKTEPAGNVIDKSEKQESSQMREKRRARMKQLKAFGGNERRVRSDDVALRNHVKRFLLFDCREACSNA